LRVIESLGQMGNIDTHGDGVRAANKTMHRLYAVEHERSETELAYP